MYLCKFGQNSSTGSEDNARKRSYADANGIRPFRLGGHNMSLTGPVVSEKNALIYMYMY